MRMMNRRRSAEFQHSQAEARRVTQSISIKKPPMLRPLDTDSPANSPRSYGSSPPASPSLASPSPSSKFCFLNLRLVYISERGCVLLHLWMFLHFSRLNWTLALQPALYSSDINFFDYAVFREKDRRWRSVFHPDGREVSRSCSAKFEHVPPPTSPTVYDWWV